MDTNTHIYIGYVNGYYCYCCCRLNVGLKDKIQRVQKKLVRRLLGRVRLGSGGATAGQARANALVKSLCPGRCPATTMPEFLLCREFKYTLRWLLL